MCNESTTLGEYRLIKPMMNSKFFNPKKGAQNGLIILDFEIRYYEGHVKIILSITIMLKLSKNKPIRNRTKKPV
ncbi:hypothetical protein [Methanococcus voltae]|uniref:hypothetical protein n=1 Tax=Methanococcus voltae TaxID=2188 RepID=UPI001AE7AAFA|nr:hypothetical protein [Methanococcus voltae]MBP2173104.1 hypothetical protein [Methanococcus voltae]